MFGLALVRVREHVNPLSKKYQVAIDPPDWPTAYQQPGRSLHLDIGCGRGRFLLKMAIEHPDQNFLGLEIRAPLVEEANRDKQELGLTNLHYLFCNANICLRPLLKSLPMGVLKTVTIQFPDPWFKRRHQKRRMVQPDLVSDLADFLGSSGIVFIQSDVFEVANEIRDRFDQHPQFSRTHPNWLDHNPFPIATERELLVLSFHDPVYRALFVRN